MSTDVATKTVLGVSISPNALSAAVLSGEDFALLNCLETPLPENILTEDGQRILDLGELTQLLIAFKSQLNLSEDAEPIETYLSIVPSVLDTQQVESRQPHAVRHEIEQLVLMPDVVQQGILKDEQPVLQHTTMGQNDDEILVGYGLAGSQLIQDYEEAFSQAGFALKSIDLLPLCVLRAMAASGVLDALVEKIGPKGVWGCFGTVGAKTWITLWQGTDLLELGSFNTPKSKQAWRNRILTVLELAGVDEPELWLSWQETGSLVPAVPAKLELKAPIKEAFLGPMYKAAATAPGAFPALGAALKADIGFPLNWEFLSQRIPDAVSPRATYISERTQARKLPRLMWASIAAFVVVLVLSWVVSGQNKEFASVTQLQNDHVKATLNVMTRENNLYSHVLERVSAKAAIGNRAKGEGVQLEQVRLKDGDMLTVSGNAFQKVFIEQFIQRLNTTSEGDVVKMTSPTASIVLLEGKPRRYGFEYRAEVERQHGAEDLQ